MRRRLCGSLYDQKESSPKIYPGVGEGVKDRLISFIQKKNKKKKGPVSS